MADGQRNANMGHNESKIIIAEVEKRPPLYDRRLEDYNNRVLKDKLWDEVCAVVFFNWNKLNKEQKIRKGNAVRSRWKNLKDCFIRELALHRKAPDKAAERKQYVHFESLFFLANTSTKKNLKDCQKIIDNYKKKLAKFRKQQENIRKNESHNLKNSIENQEENSSSSCIDLSNNQLKFSIKNDETMTNSNILVEVDLPENNSVHDAQDIQIENLAELSDDQPTLSSFTTRVQNSTEPLEEYPSSSFRRPVQISIEQQKELKKQPVFQRQLRSTRQVKNSPSIENSRLSQSSRFVKKSRLTENLKLENTGIRKRKKLKTSSMEKELLTFLKATEKDEKSFKVEMLNLLKGKEEAKSENELFAALVVSMMDKLSNEQSHYVKMEILNVLGKAKNYQQPSRFTVINGIP